MFNTVKKRKQIVEEEFEGVFRICKLKKDRQHNGQKNKGNTTGFQILLRTKYVPSLVKINRRMLILECSQGCYGRTDGR